MKDKFIIITTAMNMIWPDEEIIIEQRSRSQFESVTHWLIFPHTATILEFIRSNY